MQRAALIILVLLMIIGGAGWLIVANQPNPALTQHTINTPPPPSTTPATSAPASRPLPPPHPPLRPITAKPVLPPPPPPHPKPKPAPTPPLATAPASKPAEPPFQLVRGRDGYWQIVQDRRGVWWFRSPTGQLEFLNTVTTVQPYQLPRDKNGPHFVSRDWDSTGKTPEDLDRWAAATIDRIHSYGFKALGAWCHPALHRFNIPITRDLNLWTWLGGNQVRFYGVNWASSVEGAVKQQVESLRDNKNLVGYFIDNELDWGDGVAGPAAYFDALPPDDPNRRQVLRVIQSVWKSIADFNADWKTSFTDFKDLDTWKEIPRQNTHAYARLSTIWLHQLAEDYFRTTTTLIRKYDPNHLILGVRYKGHALPEVVRAARDFTDAQSLNYYVGDARLDLDMFRMINQLSNQPIILSEYSFHALDGRSGNRNTVGFVSQVPDQQARADGYKLFTSRLARVPYVIGADWFQWCDEAPSGRASDGEDANFGVVDIDDRPYPQLVAAIQQLAPTLNTLHQESPADQQADLWRESFANKPLMNIPFLTQPPVVNGELSDWPVNSKLPGLRHSPIIGLERSAIPVPNVFLGWTAAGLYLGMEIFDNDIHGAPAKGWWWTRDCVELWLSTRPVASDQHDYDVFCHQFFFVPIEFPGPDGATGVVGQWHRGGDNLKDHLIPHPAIQQASRILPDRYVVEMFIPAAALNGFDPIKQPALAFNIHARNFEHALSYFWSAPKEVLTQNRPSTWGSLYLRAPDITFLPTTRPTAILNTSP